MKPSFLSYFSGVSFAAISMTFILGLTACGQKKDDSTAAVDARTRAAGVAAVSTNTGGYINNKGAYLNSGSGLFTQALSTSQFRQNTLDFIASTWDTRGTGDIDETSVLIQGFLELSTANQINLNTTNLKIWISDSYAKNGTMMENNQPAVPYYVTFKNAASGTMTSNSFNILFRDDYQEVTLSGTYDANYAYGSLSFRNLKDATGGTLKSANPMGYFAISTCALMNCRK